MSKTYTIKETRIRLFGNDTTKLRTGTLDELIEYYEYTLESGYEWGQIDRKGKKVDRHPKTIKGLLRSLNNAAANSCTHYTDHSYELLEA